MSNMIAISFAIKNFTNIASSAESEQAALLIEKKFKLLIIEAKFSLERHSSSVIN